jgi:hypothetical protein
MCVNSQSRIERAVQEHFGRPNLADVLINRSEHVLHLVLGLDMGGKSATKLPPYGSFNCRVVNKEEALQNNFVAGYGTTDEFSFRGHFEPWSPKITRLIARRIQTYSLAITLICRMSSIWICGLPR